MQLHKGANVCSRTFARAAIVKKITYEKCIDIFPKIIIIIIVKGRVRLDKRRLKLIHWQASPLDKNIKKHKKDIDTI